MHVLGQVAPSSTCPHIVGHVVVVGDAADEHVCIIDDRAKKAIF
jgi:hypothetical protein